MQLYYGRPHVLKIAMLASINFPPSEGIGMYIYNLSQKLVEKGHDVIIVTRGRVRHEIQLLNGIKIYMLPFILTFPFHVDIHGKFVRKFFNELDDFDILHIHSPMPPPCNPSLIPTVISTFHSTLQTSWKNEAIGPLALFNRIFGILSRHLESGIIKSSDRITTVSNSVSIDLQRFYGLKDSEINIVGNAVNDRFLTSNSGKEKERDGYVLWVGRIDYGKGLFDLISAMKIITRERPDVKLILVGEGPLRAELIKEVYKRRLHKNVFFLGFFPNEKLPNIYKNASVYVQSSYSEGLPTTVLEAMSCGTPVVATKVSGNVDIVKDGESGILVPPKDPVSLAKSIIHIIDNPEYGKQLGNNSRQIIRENYTLDVLCNKFLYYYKNNY